VNRVSFTGCAFSGGSVVTDLAPPDFAVPGVTLGSGDLVFAGSLTSDFSLVAGIGVAEVNTVDWAHPGHTQRTITAMAGARHFIMAECLPKIVPIRIRAYVNKDATGKAAVNPWLKSSKTAARFSLAAVVATSALLVCCSLNPRHARQ